MPDATDWLVEHYADGQPQYERFNTVNDAIPFLHKVLGTGQRPRLYKQVAVSLTIDVGGDAVKPKRKHRKKEAAGTADADARAPEAKVA